MSTLRRIKLRTPDGTESIEYPLGVEAKNVEVANQENLSQRLVRIDEDLENNEEDIAAVNEIAGTNRQNIGAAEVRIDALERRSASVDKKPYYFDTVADMKAYQGLAEGDMVITLGYHTINDGGGAKYKIKNESNIYYEILNNNLKAELIIEMEMNLIQFGCYGDNTHDDTNSFQNAIGYNDIILNGNNLTYKINNRVTATNKIILKNCNFFIDSSQDNKRIFKINNLECYFCNFESINNIDIDNSYVAGKVSNIDFIYVSNNNSSLRFENCNFKNGLHDILIQSTEDTYINKSLYMYNCSSLNAALSIEGDYMEDVQIINSSFIQHEGVKSLAHIIYLQDGTNNKLKIDNCFLQGFSFGLIHGYHGSNYKVDIYNSKLISSQNYCFILDGNTSTLHVYNSEIHGDCLVDTRYNPKETIFMNCKIFSNDRVSGGVNPVMIPIFKNCYIEIKNLLCSIPTNFINCTIKSVGNSTTANIIQSEKIYMYYCNFIYNCSSDNPIRITGGEAELIKCVFQNLTSTKFAWFISNATNILIKDNIFINIPKLGYGYTDYTDNLFVTI